MDGQWILGALLGLVVFVAGLRGTRWAIGRAARSHEATAMDTWQRGLAEQVFSEGLRFEGRVYYFVSGAAIGVCLVLASVLSLVPIWIGVLGLFMAVVGTASAEALARYGNANAAALVRTMRGWLRTRGLSE